jgi:hypothetical protein
MTAASLQTSVNPPHSANHWQHLPPHRLLLLLLRRMVVNNDFDVQFNSSAMSQPGLSLPPYRYNVTARPR